MSLPASEVTALFLYYGDLAEPLRAKHLAALQGFCDAVVPLSFARLTVANQTAVANQYYHADSLVYTWFPQRAGDSRRYLVIEYDTLVAQSPDAWFGKLWDAPVAGPMVVRPDGKGEVWPGGPIHKLYFLQRRGLTPAAIASFGKENLRALIPLTCILLSHEALSAMAAKYAAEPLMQAVQCEYRVGTLAKLCGFEPQPVPGAWYQVFKPASARPSKAGIWHPVKVP